MSIGVGDSITLVYTYLVPLVECTYVASVDMRYRWFSVLSVSKHTILGAALDREGITWIRGHHAADSTDVQACRAAVLLVS